jgi:sugar-specific transcriptional regulator TrmB
MVTNNDNKFITDSKEITNSIKAIFQKAKWIRCAVAYWGKGASDTILKELKTQDIIIIANAFSGGCNPAEIEKLIENFHGKVYSDEYLHAKVYCSNLGVVIGSANASTNGLGIEGTNATSLNEAVIFSQNYEIIKNVRSWFDKIVNENKCNLIDKSDLAIIKENYERRAKGIIFKKRFLDSVLYGDYKENIYIVVAFSMPKNDPIAKGAKEVITKASRKHPNMINTKDTDWYYDIDKDKFPFGKKVFGFIRDHNGGKI